MKRLDVGRLEDRFPTIYITLISVLLAVGLEDTVSRLRDTGIQDPFDLEIAVFVAASVLACWTGYSFVAITQVRRPRLMDSINVFGLAVGILVLNSTIGVAHHYFFIAFSVYMVLAVYAVVYNMGLLSEVMPFDMRFSDWSSTLWVLLAYLPISTALAWLSYAGHLAGRTETALTLILLTQPIVWPLAFYTVWNRAVARATEES